MIFTFKRRLSIAGAPKVKILSHLDLFPHIHETLLFRWFVDFMIRGHRHDFDFLYVIDIVSS